MKKPPDRGTDKQIIHFHHIHTKYKVPIKVLAHLLEVTDVTIYHHMDKLGLKPLGSTVLRKEYGGYVGEAEAKLIKYLFDFGVSTEKISTVSGRARMTVRDVLRRLNKQEIS